MVTDTGMNRSSRTRWYNSTPYLIVPAAALTFECTTERAKCLQYAMELESRNGATAVPSVRSVRDDPELRSKLQAKISQVKRPSGPLRNPDQSLLVPCEMPAATTSHALLPTVKNS